MPSFFKKLKVKRSKNLKDVKPVQMFIYRFKFIK